MLCDIVETTKCINMSHSCVIGMNLEFVIGAHCRSTTTLSHRCISVVVFFPRAMLFINYNALQMIRFVSIWILFVAFIVVIVFQLRIFAVNILPSLINSHHNVTLPYLANVSYLHLLLFRRACVRSLAHSLSRYRSVSTDGALSWNLHST